MTQIDAVIKSLEILGGKAQLKQIYPIALKIPGVDWSNTKDPTATIRRIVQTCGKTRPSNNNKKGWWELLSYNEEITELKRRIADLEKERDEILERFSPKRCITLEQIEESILESPDWETAKACIDSINLSEILAETDWPKISRKLRQKFKAMKQQEKENAAKSATVVVNKGGNYNENVKTQVNVAAENRNKKRLTNE